jgi:hypothetical protein
MTLAPPSPKDWLARYDVQPADFNTHIRDAFNFLAGPPRFRAVQNGIQSGIAQNTWTTIQMQSVLEDNYSGWTSGASNYYAAQQPGWYGITLMVQAAIAAGNVARVGLQYQVNGTIVGPFEFNQSENGINPWGWSGYDEVYLATGDRVYPQFYQMSAGSISTSLAAPSSLEVVWVSE